MLSEAWQGWLHYFQSSFESERCVENSRGSFFYTVALGRLWGLEDLQMGASSVRQAAEQHHSKIHAGIFHAGISLGKTVLSLWESSRQGISLERHYVVELVNKTSSCEFEQLANGLIRNGFVLWNNWQAGQGSVTTRNRQFSKGQLQA